MLANASVTTMLPVIDMDRARAFYERSLGLKPSGLRPDGKFIYQVGGSTLALFTKHIVGRTSVDAQVIEPVIGPSE